jgi:putative transposase
MPNPTPLRHGACYHIYNRGNNGENLFIETRNYAYFLRLYEKHIAPIADTYAYCLLRNHFHLLVRIKTPHEIQQKLETARVAGSGKSVPAMIEALRAIKNPSQRFGNLFNAYTKAMNKAYGRTGSLFEHPFHRILIDNPEYFLRLVTYIHQNPQKHGLVDNFCEWPYSSYASTNTSLTWLSREAIVNRFGGEEQMNQMHNELIPASLLSAILPGE